MLALFLNRNTNLNRFFYRVNNFFKKYFSFFFRASVLYNEKDPHQGGKFLCILPFLGGGFWGFSTRFLPHLLAYIDLYLILDIYFLRVEFINSALSVLPSLK